MFQPNSIKTLKNLKIDKELESLSQQSPRTESDHAAMSNSVREIISTSKEHPYNQLLDNREIIDEVNQRIDDIRKWREDQKQRVEIEKQKNKQKIEIQELEDRNKHLRRDQEIQDYLEELQKIAQLEDSQVSAVIKKQQSTKDQQEVARGGSDIVYAEAAWKVKFDEQKKKLEQLADLDKVVDKAYMEVNEEELCMREQILKDMKIDERDDTKIDSLNKGLGEWEAQLELLLGGLSSGTKAQGTGSTGSSAAIAASQARVNATKAQSVTSASSKYSQMLQKEGAPQNNNLQDEIDELDKEFEELERMFQAGKQSVQKR